VDDNEPVVERVLKKVAKEINPSQESMESNLLTTNTQTFLPSFPKYTEKIKYSKY
jgi:uncharacterized protein (UPF0276 family)